VQALRLEKVARSWDYSLQIIQAGLESAIGFSVLAGEIRSKMTRLDASMCITIASAMVTKSRQMVRKLEWSTSEYAAHKALFWIIS